MYNVASNTFPVEDRVVVSFRAGQEQIILMIGKNVMFG